VPYCTEADVQIAVGGAAKLAQLSDQDNLLGGAVNHAVVAAAISEATNEIASFVGHRISINAIAAAIPPLLVTKAAAWAARVLRRDAYNGQPLADDLDREEIERKWLLLAAEGRVSLGVEPELPNSDIVTDAAKPRSSSYTISRERFKGFA
jgi:phage gp36-like protein